MSSNVPVLSAKLSIGTPMVFNSVKYRFASGVSSLKIMFWPVSRLPPPPPASTIGKLDALCMSPSRRLDPNNTMELSNKDWSPSFIELTRSRKYLNCSACHWLILPYISMRFGWLR